METRLCHVRPQPVSTPKPFIIIYSSTVPLFIVVPQALCDLETSTMLVVVYMANVLAGRCNIAVCFVVKQFCSFFCGPETNEIGTHICSCHNFSPLSSVQIFLIPACCLLCVL